MVCRCVRGLKSDGGAGGGGRAREKREAGGKFHVLCERVKLVNLALGLICAIIPTLHGVWTWRVPSFLSPLSPDIREERKSMQNENAEHTDEVGNDQAHLLFYDAWKESHHST